MMRWGNIEKAIVAYLTETVEVTYTQTAGTMPDRYLRVERVGGSGEWIARNVTIEIRAVAATRGDLWDLVDAVDSAMQELADGDPSDDLYADDVTVNFGFAWDPPTDAAKTAAIGTYTLTLRPRKV